MVNKNDISEIVLERYVLGELTEPERQRVDAILSQRDDLKQKVEFIKQHNVTYLENHPAEHVYRAFLKKNEDKNVKFVNRFALPVSVPSAVAVILVAVMVLPQLSSFNEQGNYQELSFDETDNIRLKGIEPKLNVYKKINNELEKLGNNSIAHTNEVIQLSYVAGEMEYGAIFSIDGRGSVTLHFPKNITDSTRLNSDGETALDFAYQLDDAPDFERFFFVTSKTEINVSDVLFSAQKLAENKVNTDLEKLKLEQGVSQKIISLKKQ